MRQAHRPHSIDPTDRPIATVETLGPASADSVRAQRRARRSTRFLRALGLTVAFAITAASSLIALSGESAAEEIDARVFDLATDADFSNYEHVVKEFARKHRPGAPNDFCVLGHVGDDESKRAWVLWRQGKQIILWEGRDADLDFSRRKIDLRTDVVPTADDVHGSTYLVTKAWVDELAATCDRAGAKLHLGKSTTPRPR